MVVLEKYLAMKLGKNVDVTDYISHYENGVFIPCAFVFYFCGDDAALTLDGAKHPDFAAFTKE